MALNIQAQTSIALQSAARTAAISSAPVYTGQHHGVNVYAVLSSVTGTTPTIGINIERKDPASGIWATLLGTVATGANTTYVLTIFPGATVTANVSANQHPGQNLRVTTVLGGTVTSYTLSVAFELLP